MAQDHEEPHPLRVHTSLSKDLRARALRALAVLGASLLLCSACTKNYADPDFLTATGRETVSEAAFRYNNALRFGNLEMAMQWVEPEHRTEFLTVFSDTAAKPIRFTDVEISEVAPGPSKGEARVLLSVRYYRLPSVHEVVMAQEQGWRYDADRKRWYVTPDFDAYTPKSERAKKPASAALPASPAFPD